MKPLHLDVDKVSYGYEATLNHFQIDRFISILKEMKKISDTITFVCRGDDHEGEITDTIIIWY